MPKINDLQAILLSTASQRENGSLLPYPESISASPSRVRSAVATLIKHGLAHEVEANSDYQSWRLENDQRFGAVATEAGLAAIGVTAELADATGDAPGETQVAVPTLREPRQNKTALVLSLLRRDEGATLADLTSATGWLPHTTRAALTGLRKKGHQLDKTRRDDQTCYRIAGAE